MADYSNQLPGGVSRQSRVAVQRDAIANGSEDGCVAHPQHEAGVSGPSKQSIELFDLAAFALPAHPEMFLFIPLASAIEKEETIGTAVGMFGVERADTLGRRRQNVGVERQHLHIRVLEVAQDGEMKVWIEVAERRHLEMGHQLTRPLDAVENRRHDDHRAG